MDSKIVNLTLPAALLKDIDEAAKANYESRSDYIRQSVVLRLKNQQIRDLQDQEDQLQAIIDQALKQARQ